MSLDAGDYADERVEEVRDDPPARLTFLRQLYRVPADVDQGYLPFRRAASAFMRWQLRRGLLNPESDPEPGSSWWRAVNAALLRDTCEASAMAFGRSGEPRTAGAAATLAFIRAPSARTWYRAHNTTIASAYLANVHLARREGRVERFFLNLVLIRVLYAHALVARPRLALDWLAPLGPLLGDPRLGMTSIFLSLSRVLPDRYPLDDDVEPYVDAEHGFGHLLDVGLILPRLAPLYRWSARELGLPGVCDLVEPEALVPTYAWDPADRAVWRPTPSWPARILRVAAAHRIRHP